jgi:hypothetical protein
LETPLADRDGATRVVSVLEHIAQFRNTLAVQNRALNAALSRAIAIGEPLALKASRGELSVIGEARTLERRDGLWRANSGQRLGFDVTNKSAQRLFVTVFRFGGDFSVTRIAPEDEWQATLAPGRTLEVRFRAPTLQATSRPATETVKVFATNVPVSLDSLLLPRLSEVSAPPRLQQVRSAGPLSTLLDSLRRTATRPIRPLAEQGADDQWITRQFSFVVEPNI